MSQSSSSYWNLDAIVCESTKVPCHFKLNVPGLAHLQGDGQVAASGAAASRRTVDDDDAGADDDDEDEGTIQTGAKLELPFWLAELMTLHDYVDISFPRQYAARVRAALDADPKSVQLRGLNNWWYAVGGRLGALAESTELMEILSATYIARLAPIFSAAQHLASMGPATGTGVDVGGGSGGANGGGGNDAAVDPDAPGFGSGGIGMSTEMVEFMRGLEEGERALLGTGHDAARATRVYLAGR